MQLGAEWRENPFLCTIGGFVSIQDTLEAFQQRLVERGLKSTRQRGLIVETFFELDRHVNVDELLLEVRKRRASTGYATVYRTLKLLVDLGFANERRFGGPETPTIYDPSFERDEHFHLICLECQHIIEFRDVPLEKRHEAIAREQGFTLQQQTLDLYGHCTRENCPRRPQA